MTFKVVIVGRPNVGKSTLFNRLVGQKLALVDDQPGVTRDRREADARLGDLAFTIIDTAGLDEAGKGSLEARMRAQTEAAIREADIVLFMFDARAGITAGDETFAGLARRSGKPVILLANKSEARNVQAGAVESFALGLGDPILLSAEHGEGLGDLYDALAALMPQPEKAEDEITDDDNDDEAGPDKPIRVAIVGRPNAGKSTLVNALLGQDRLLTGPEAGITRDTISVDLDWNGRAFKLFDTAGLRKRGRVVDKVEKLSVGDALRAIRFAEVVVVLMDATTPFEDQDLRIADLIVREGRAVVIAMSKWDLVARKGGQLGKLREEVDHWLPQIRGVPVVTVSALSGAGLEHLMGAVEDAYAVWNKRVSTNALNRWLGEATHAHAPPAVTGRKLKLRYMTQAKARPPSFVIFCSRADAMPDSYLRYLTNGIREAFDMPGTPIRITLREKDNPFDKR
jgi:GTP-binding protein